MLVIFLLMFPSPLLSSCYWTSMQSSWSTGYRADLVIMPNTSVHGWQVGVTTDPPLDKFEAWKGSVAGGGNHYQISSKCYNHMVYSCQCLVIPYLARHQAGVTTSYTITFNNQEIEMCDQEPECGATTPAPHTTTTDNTNLRLLDFDNLSWMKEEDPHTCFHNPCQVPTSCQAPSDQTFTCVCPELYLNIDTDDIDGDKHCEKEDTDINLALALSEKEINETVKLISAGNETAGQGRRLARSDTAELPSMVYIYSFADTVQSIRTVMQAQNICRLFSELDQMDRDWPDSSLTCMQARDRYWEIQAVLDNFKMEDKFSLAREYRKMSSWVGLDNIKNTGSNFHFLGVI